MEHKQTDHLSMVSLSKQIDELKETITKSLAGITTAQENTYRIVEDVQKTVHFNTDRIQFAEARLLELEKGRFSSKFKHIWTKIRYGV